MNILIVDDIQDNIESLERLIKQFTRKYNINCNVQQANNGQVAVEACIENKIDIVFMDIMMPIMNGLEATKIIHNAHPNIMIVVVSSETDETTVQEVLSNGAEDYVIKPYNSSLMLKRLNNYSNLVSSRNSIGYQAKAKNIFTHKVYSYRIHFFISSEDELAQFWETMLVRLEFQTHIAYLSDFIRLIFQLAAFQIKKSYKCNVFVEEDADFFYFTMDNMKLLPTEQVNKLIEKECQEILTSLEGDLISFALPRFEKNIHESPIPEKITENIQVEEKIVIQKDALQTYTILNTDELEDLEFTLAKLQTEIAMMGTSDLNLEDIDTMNTSINNLANILSISSDAYNISISLQDFYALLNEHSEEFLEKSKDLAKLMSSFLSDLIMWKDMIFYTGAPSVDFLDNSIVSNVQMIRAVFIIDESEADDLDDIFDF